MINQSAVLVMVLAAGCAMDSSPETSSATALLELQQCSGERIDGFLLGDLSVVGDELHIQVQTGGGCAPHTFAVCWNGAVLDSSPQQANFALVHDGHGDTCDALLTHDLRVDLSTLRTKGERPIVLHVTGATSQLDGTTNSATYE